MIFETCEQEGPEQSFFTVQSLQMILRQKMAEEALNQILGVDARGATMTREDV